jgi:hypothetical protein
MTSKQIAEAVGKDERTVQRWIKKAGDKMSSVADKSSVAGHGKAADFTEEETLVLLKQGLVKMLLVFTEQTPICRLNPRPTLPPLCEKQLLRWFLYLLKWFGELFRNNFLRHYRHLQSYQAETSFAVL